MPSVRPSEEAKQRVAHLIELDKSDALTPEEKSELEHYVQLEHLMRLAKARAATPVMSVYVSAELRRLVADHAGHRCEYCLIRENDTYFGCEVDHVVSTKHGGATAEDNPAYACMVCNRRKGSDLGSLLRRTGELIRFFNPRMDVWEDHFELSGARIEPRTDIGEVTSPIFGFNDGERILERDELISQGRYP